MRYLTWHLRRNASASPTVGHGTAPRGSEGMAEVWRMLAGEDDRNASANKKCARESGGFLLREERRGSI